MTKIRYTGDINPCRVKIANGFIDKWYTGEIKEIKDDFAHKLLVQAYFELADGDVSEPKIEEPKEEQEIVNSENVETPFDYENALKDELLDYTARHNIDADYSNTVKELRAKIKEFIEKEE